MGKIKDFLEESPPALTIDREKEIKYLMYLKSQLIKETKKELKDLKQELNSLNAAKTLRKKI